MSGDIFGCHDLEGLGQRCCWHPVRVQRPGMLLKILQSQDSPQQRLILVKIPPAPRLGSHVDSHRVAGETLHSFLSFCSVLGIDVFKPNRHGKPLQGAGVVYQGRAAHKPVSFTVLS